MPPQQSKEAAQPVVCKLRVHGIPALDQLLQTPDWHVEKGAAHPVDDFLHMWPHLPDLNDTKAGHMAGQMSQPPYRMDATLTQ